MRIRARNRIITKISPRELKIMNNASRYLLARDSGPDYINDLAARFSFSVDQFEKLYRKVHGESVKQTMVRAKIQKAIEKMKEPGLSFDEICQIIGYHDPHYFSRIFKDYCGCSPSSYKEKYLER